MLNIPKVLLRNSTDEISSQHNTHLNRNYALIEHFLSLINNPARQRVTLVFAVAVHLEGNEIVFRMQPKAHTALVQYLEQLPLSGLLPSSNCKLSALHKSV